MCSKNIHIKQTCSQSSIYIWDRNIQEPPTSHHTHGRDWCDGLVEKKTNQLINENVAGEDVVCIDGSMYHGNTLWFKSE